MQITPTYLLIAMHNAQLCTYFSTRSINVYTSRQFEAEYEE